MQGLPIFRYGNRLVHDEDGWVLILTFIVAYVIAELFTDSVTTKTVAPVLRVNLRLRLMTSVTCSPPFFGASRENAQYLNFLQGPPSHLKSARSR